MDLIEVRRLVKNYHRVRALRGVSFKIEKGITGLTGPNGAGKTTIIKILLGLISADGGEATLFGLNCRKGHSKILEKVGVLHEKPCFPSWVTGRQYLEYIAKIKRTPHIKEEIKHISKICGLTDFIERTINTFSAGMIQRLGLADALIGSPELVILDEPTANLDPLGRHNMLTQIKYLADEEDMSFLISTHILSELERICGSMIILNEGLVLEYGLISQLVSKLSRPRYAIKVDNQEKFVKDITKQTATRLEVEDDLVIVHVEDFESFIEEVNNMVRRRVIVLRELRPLSPTLEDIFIEVMRRKFLEKE
jgi:ABC-2 type transport system ATP-binding protein